MVKYHPWHYGKESSDKTFFHMGENYHYSFNYLSTLDFLIIMCPVSLTFTKKRKKRIIWILINFSHQKWVALISFFILTGSIWYLIYDFMIPVQCFIVLLFIKEGGRKGCSEFKIFH